MKQMLPALQRIEVGRSALWLINSDRSTAITFNGYGYLNGIVWEKLINEFRPFDKTEITGIKILLGTNIESLVHVF